MATAVFINELHYDNAGSDTGELIEIAGPAGTSLAGWSIMLYNGNGGTAYAARPLSGIIPSQDGGFGTLAFAYPVNGIQNGAPDGIALVDDRGTVVQFLSYEGSLAAVGGPADGLRSTDIGVAEDGATPPGFSLRLIGVGRTYEDFTWAAAAPATPGAVNTGQDFGAPPTATPRLAIYDIQGAGHVSPHQGRTVATSGIVSAVDSDGFYLQDPTGDGNEATSDGIFVRTGSRPSVSFGDRARVVGTVDEHLPGGSARNLTVTEIAGDPSVSVLSSGNPVPRVIIGAGHRAPPTETIDDDRFALFDPRNDGIDFYESLEGMRVTLRDAVVVGPRNAFGEIFVVSNAPATGLNTRGGITVGAADANPEWIQIDEDAGIRDIVVPEVDVGDGLGNVTGIVSYAFGDYELLPTQALAVTPGAPARERTTLAGDADHLLVATYNVGNLDPGDGPARFAALARQIVRNLNAPDVIALQEVQDNDGPRNSAVVRADVTLGMLADAIVAAGGPAYAFIDNPLIGDDRSGGEPGGNIRNAFLYDPSRVELVGPDGNLRTVVDPLEQRTDADNPFFASRLPLAIDIGFNGRLVTLVNNHFTAKTGSTELYGSVQPPINGGVAARLDQAGAVNAFVADILADDPGADVVVLGDLNELQFLAPLQRLERGGDSSQELFNTTLRLDEVDRYSFIFEGNSQSLDHILVTAGLDRGVTADAVHINAELADRASDHDPRLALLDLAPEVRVARLDLTPVDPGVSYEEDGALVAHIPPPLGGTLSQALAPLPIDLRARGGGDLVLHPQRGLGVEGAGDDSLGRDYVEGGEAIEIAIGADAAFDLAYGAELGLTHVLGAGEIELEAFAGRARVARETFVVPSAHAVLDLDAGTVFDRLLVHAMAGTDTTFGLRSVSLYATEEALVA